VGLELAIQIAQDLEGCTGATILTDNQAAIQALAHLAISSGQQITHRVIQEINQARGKGIGITIQWTPSHEGIPGNEEVDMLAKRATEWDPQRKTARPDFRASPYQIYTLRSAILRRNARGEGRQDMHGRRGGGPMHTGGSTSRTHQYHTRHIWPPMAARGKPYHL
jgi:hypothetical protein